MHTLPYMCQWVMLPQKDPSHKGEMASPLMWLGIFAVSALVSAAEIRGQALCRKGSSDPGTGWGVANQPKPGMEGLSGIGRGTQRAGPQRGPWGPGQGWGRPKPGIPSGQLGLFFSLRKLVVAVARPAAVWQLLSHQGS